MPSRLVGTLHRIPEIHSTLMEDLFALMNKHFECVTEAQFTKDFLDKDYVILLRDRENGIVQGFSTAVLYDREVIGQRVKLLFSGDTIVNKDYWGEQELVKIWCRLAGKVSAQFPENKLYWLLISKGYRTYLYLPLFSFEFYPRYDKDTPLLEQEIMNDFGRFKYGHYFKAEQGIIHFEESHGHLGPDLAEIPEHQNRNPHTAFFLRKNPCYRQGSELVCLTRLEQSNMRSVARRSFIQGICDAQQLLCSVA
jgi:hypothetical protein